MFTKTSILVLSLCLLGVLAFSMPAVGQTQEALQFNSASSQYVTFGNSGTLGAKTFTIELRFKRTGAGVATSTGTGGVSAIPLLTKGRAEADGSNLDCNYFLGIDGTTGRLVADFEDTTASNNNHPVSGTTVIQNDIWYHAAATFDGTNFRIYLNGNLEGSVTSAAKPRYDSIQHASLASALTSSGAAAGFFTGILDEARIWNIARSQSQLQTDMNLEVLSGTGLLARWGLNEGAGTTAGNSVAGSVNGTLTNAPLWTTDSPLPLSTAAGLRFGGTNGYVTFGNTSVLGLKTFTIETWFRRDGAGTTTSTGAITAVPLVTKGRGEADGSNVDCNYFLGIDGATGRLAADFEDTTLSNNNHPVFGTTTIVNGVWYHAAATFDGTNFRIYLNGNLEGSVTSAAKPRYDSIQHAGLATAMTSTGVAGGFFNGALDEARIWNVARTQGQIASAINSELTGPTTGLVARWGLNEDAQTTVFSSAGTAVNGTITGSNWAWSAGSPFNAVPPTVPADPTSLSATPISSAQIDVSWTDNANNETSYEVERSTTGAGGPFSPLITLPANATGYSNLGLTASTEYCYRVRAVNNVGPSNYAGPACATTLAPLPPADPTNLVVTAPTYGQVHLTWTDNATDETNFELERSTAGIGGPFSLIATLSANTGAYDDLNRNAGTEYCYRVRAVSGQGPSGYAGPSCITTPAASSTALDFGSAGTTYASFGSPAGLQLSSFTLEMWFRRDGAGVGTSTGAGGIPDLIPLIAKGRAEVEDPAKDINYIFGIRASDGVLCADFEEGASGPSPSLNHPVAGTTPITTGVWHHAAATYDGTTWNLYLDGNLEASLSVGRPVASGSGVAVAMASALTSTNVPAGYFDGAIDEVRIWSVARTKSQIQATANMPIIAATSNLVGRWSLDEGSGSILNASAGTTNNGTLVNSNYSWAVPGAPFNLVFTPNPPSGLAANAISQTQIDLSWADNSSDETGFEIERSTTGTGGPFSPLATVAANTASYPDQGLTASTEYCYRVRAVNTAGPSAYDGPACATTAATATHTLTVSVDPNGSGTVLKNPDLASYLEGSTVELTAVPDTGYHFVNWTGDLTGTTNPDSVTMNADHSVVAHFAINTYVLTVTTVGNGSVSKDPDQALYDHGMTVSLTATSDTGWVFTGWSGDASGSTNPLLVTMDASKTITATFSLAPDALDFAGTNGYVNFGNPASLKLSAFTLELWVRRDGTGTGTDTGTNGIPNLVPLIAKGRADIEDPLRDINYILGIRASDGVLAADFEEAAAPSPNPSLNHPVAGVTPLAVGTWYHVAATYDGSTWRLYVNGNLDASLSVGRTPASASNAPVSLASALIVSGTASGFMNGAVDEVRIWSVARTQGQIAATINQRLSSPITGLVARWSLDEGTGTTVHSTAGTTIDGTLTASGWTWATGAPFNATPPTPPAAPTALAASPSSSTQVSLSWTDNASDETGFEIERSTSGIGGPFSPLATVAANTTSYPDQGLTASTEYCYQVRAVNNVGPSAYAGPTCATTLGSSTAALSFSESTYVTFGDPAALDLAQFTIECWFRRDGTGTTTSTGSGGITDAIPLVTHGTSQTDGTNVDENYFLGIRNSDGVLCADFEEGAGGPSPGLNHPVIGVTPVGMAVWHHAAATYDGTTWNLYLDGSLERTLVVGRPPRSDSIQHAALASSLTSTGTAQGFFNGVLDEVRVWNFARTGANIQSSANAQLTTPQSGLVARWSLDEGAGTAVNSSAGTTVNGTITGPNYAWVGPAPFNLTFTAPAAPSGLSATAANHNRIDLTWTDNSGNETTFEIERSTSGIGGPFSPLATVAANVTSYADGTVSALTEYCYRVRASNSFGASAYAGPDCETTPDVGTTALDLAGNTYVGFGSPGGLQLGTFTIELWLRRDGAGVGTSTGSGGIADAIPLVAKGRAETETATTDVNYLLGIRASDGVLCADFEEGQAGSSPSLNHPVVGQTPITTGIWHHVAVSYDGAWKLYLDGNLEASTDIGQPPASASTVPVALGTALNSSSVASGFFDGVVDEVRIWNVARTQAQIQSTANIQIGTPTTGLVARWALDEGSGTVVTGSAGTTFNGNITGAAYSWVSGAPFNLSLNQAPSPPVLLSPANNATEVNTSATLSVSVSDPDTGTVTVSYYGRPVTSTASPDFTIIGLPDTQYYTSELNGGTNAMFLSQTNWIVANKASRNIVYVTQLGDCTEHGDNGGNDIEWQRADANLSVIENPATTGLPDGIPYGVCVGNHDQSPIGDADGTTTFYNQYFGAARFGGRNYYGGHYGTNNDNWYDLFSASGMDFIAISFEYDTTPDAPILTWADNLLTTYGNRRAIVMSHFICNTGNPGSFGAQGQAIYNALKVHPNLFLMLCGHVPGEGRRQDTFNGNTVHTLLSDYQARTNGGNGWLRIMEFSPAHNVIRVKTYSPWLNQFEADADSSSQFTIPYNMSASQPFTLIGTLSGVPSGSVSTIQWPELATTTSYEWYVTVSDSAATVTSPIWRFTTRATYTISASASRGGSIDPTGEVAVPPGSDQTFTSTPDDGYFLTNLMVDGVPQGAVSSYTFIGVTTNHTIEAVFSSPTGIGDGVPAAFVFGGVSPNPAHRQTRMRFGVPRSAHVSLDVYDVSGRRVAKVADRTFEPGYHELSWSGTGDMGSVPSGIYFMRFAAGEAVMTRRFVLIR